MTASAPPNQRLQRVRAALDEARLDGLYVSSPVDDVNHHHSANRRYLAGFTGSTGYAVVSATEAVLAVDARYSAQARREAQPCGFTVFDTKGRQASWLPELIAATGLGGKRLGLSKADLSYGDFVSLEEAVDLMPAADRPKLVPALPMIEKLRAVKDAGELALLEEAIVIAERAFSEVRANAGPGTTERAFAASLDAAVKRAGARRLSFDPIVASGERGAMPHADLSERAFQVGEPIIVDWGAEIAGYCSDLTRTFYLEREPERFREVYEVVQEGQRAAIEGVEAGHDRRRCAHARCRRDCCPRVRGRLHSWPRPWRRPGRARLPAPTSAPPPKTSSRTAWSSRSSLGSICRAGVGCGSRISWSWKVAARASSATSIRHSQQELSVSQISTGDFRRGVTIEMNDKLYSVLSYDHIKTGRGSAQVRMKLRDIRSGAIIDHTVQAGTKFDRARVERREMQYLYPDGDLYYFMNTETYDQIPVDAGKIGDAAKYLKENENCEVVLYGEEVIAVELPLAVALTVTTSDPGVKGDTAQGGTKPATLETGLVVNVPLFITEGEVIRVNTETGEYIERAG